MREKLLARVAAMLGIPGQKVQAAIGPRAPRPTPTSEESPRGRIPSQLRALPVSGLPVSGPTSAQRRKLTTRERQVAALVVGGLTNRQIARELAITEGTAALHVKNILRKLGFSRRGQVILWAMERQARADAAAEGLGPDSRVHLQRIPMWDEPPSAPAQGTHRAPPELSDEEWARLAPIMPPRKRTGGVRADDRSTLNGILWVLGTGARWTDLPRRYGVASTCRLRFREWQKRGVWERICRVLHETRGDDSR